jgi:penicillin G amidase
MKLLKKTIFSLIAILALAVIGIFTYLHYLKPQYNGELKLHGLKSAAQVHFGQFAIPHIYAENEEDAYQALGYVHAQERLFQMEILRRLGSGRLSEILGPELLDVDKFFRVIGIPEISRNSAEFFLSSDSLPYQKAALAYLRGINEYISKGKTPVEYTLLGIPKENFKPVDIFYIGGYMAFSFSEVFKTDPVLSKIKEQFGEEYLKIFELHHQTGNFIAPSNKAAPKVGMIAEAFSKIAEKVPVQPWIGSNGWVIAPHKSASGQTMLVNDTHIGYSQPAVWYEAHLEYPGQNFYGNFLAGFPFALTGHNPVAGWGLTMLENDDADLYQEKENPNNKRYYQYKDGYLAYETSTETIKVKGKEDYSLTIRKTVNGPVISDVIADISEAFAEPISFRWEFTQSPNPTLIAFYKLSRATQMAEAREAASLITAPGLNILYGDKSGDIACWAAAKLAIRPKHVNPKLILNGASGKDATLGYYTFDENPHNENPTCGYLFSSNNQPDSIGDIIYPGYYAPEDRAVRIDNFFKGQETFNKSDMINLLLDNVSDKHAEGAHYLAEFITGQKQNLNNLEQEALQQLKKWDGGYSMESAGATVYHRLLSNILNKTLKDELGEAHYKALVSTHCMKQSFLKFLKAENNPWWNDINTPQQETKKDIILASFKKAVKSLEKEFGAETGNWQWQKAHLLEHIHPIGRKKPFNLLFNVQPQGVAGGNETINSSSFFMGDSDAFKVVYGPAMRRVIDFADAYNSISINPTGQSGYFMSPHYSDQAEMYNRGEFRKQQMNKEDIWKCKIGTLMLLPH